MESLIVNDELVQKWTPFLQGIDNPLKRNVLARCFENVTGHLARVKEAADEPVGRFARYAVPLTRRILHDLAIADLISVQPLGQPDGKVFYLDFAYKSAHNSDAVSIAANDLLADKLQRTYTSSGMGGYGYSGGSYSGNPATARVVEMQLTSAAVTATPRKLTGQVMVEDEQDLNTYYGISGEEELVKAIASQVIRETNLDIIKTLVYGATGLNTTFNANFPSTTLATSGIYNTLDPRIFRKKLFDYIIDVDAAIFSKRFVTSNWIIAGGDICAFMEKSNDFVVDNNPDKNQMLTGLYRFGTFKGRWTVYKYAYMPTGVLLVGYKGTSEFESGFVYAPYITAYMTPAFIDPTNFRKSRGIMTRAGTKLISGDYYGTVTVSNYSW